MKAQIGGQIFIYILSLIVVAVVLIYGYSAIQDFRKKAEEVNLVNFKNEIENAVKKSTRYGDVNPLEISLPGKYGKVCFVDSYSVLTEADKDTACICNPACGADSDPLVCDGWKTTNSSNVYLVPIADISINVGRITVDGDGDGKEDTLACQDCFYTCVENTHGKVTLILEGKGNHVLIRST